MNISKWSALESKGLTAIWRFLKKIYLGLNRLILQNKAGIYRNSSKHQLNNDIPPDLVTPKGCAGF